MTAPTKAEIREAVRAAMTASGSGTTNDVRGNLRLTLQDASAALTNPSFLALEGGSEWDGSQPDPDDIWYDLRQTEATRLRELVDAAIQEVAYQTEERLIRELTAAAETFATEYPNAPRPPTKSLVSAGA